MKLVVSVLLLAILCSVVLGDVYLHNPRGSNDRNCETNVNRNNGNRLFDSQNNGKGGYACPRAVGGPDVVTPTMYFYEGSRLPIEWTQQHSCGIGNAHCDIVIQYTCEDDFDGTGPGLRDGTPKDEADSATTRVDEATKDDPRMGTHESYEYYTRCKKRYRNRRLYLADQGRRNGNLRKLDSRAINTRQNPNGNRNGWECPEERDYYPYWHPSIWRDIAIITSNTSRCDTIVKESQNVKNKGECRGKDNEGLVTPEGYMYNNRKECVDGGGNWVEIGKFNIDPPKCISTDQIATRDNHLGSTREGVHSTYNWTIPTVLTGEQTKKKCVIRLRYNISTADYEPYNVDDENNVNAPINNDAENNGRSPIIQDQFVGGPKPTNPSANTQYWEDYGYGWELANAINTNQYGRTFQDRSYVFEIKKRPAKDRYGDDIPSDAVIHNLNVRGKRGNIVQTFPSVEYDFVPQYLEVRGGEYVHIQWTGSDYNPNRQPNDAEGGPTYRGSSQTRADRNNFMQMNVDGLNVARKAADVTMFLNPHTGKVDEELVKQLALLGQPVGEKDQQGNDKCVSYRNLRAEGKSQAEAERDSRNCGKLNGAVNPYFDAGLVRMVASGEFSYYSSRNNNFSNRSQKGKLVVRGGFFAGATISSPMYLATGLIMLISVLLFL